MAYFDLSGETLRNYRSSATAPKDLVEFWSGTLAQAREWDLGPEFSPIRTGLRQVTFFDAVYTGYGGQRVRGWFALPIPSDKEGNPLEDPKGKNFPVMVQFIGYGGGRGFPVEWISWLTAGYAVFVMDSRGQGSSWRGGVTPDGGQRPEDSDGPQVPGFMTRGISSPETYYYTRIYTDAARAVEAASLAPGVDPERLVIAGGSQGGALSIAACSLMEPGAFDQASIQAGWERPSYKIAAALVDVPFLCDIQRAIGMVDSDPYNEVVRYLKVHRQKLDKVMRTISYIDGVHLASFIKVPAFFSVGLMDNICPPSTVYAAYNAWAGKKEIVEYPFNNHEGGQNEQFGRQVDYVAELFGIS